MGKITYSISEIKWDIDSESLLKYMDSLTAEDASARLGIPCSTYAKMSVGERHNYILDYVLTTNRSPQKLVGLPEDDMIDDDYILAYLSRYEDSVRDAEIDEGDIAGALSYKYGWYLESFAYQPIQTS